MKWTERKPKIRFKDSDDLATKLCKIRGINPDDIYDYLDPDESVLHDPSELKNAEEASMRIIQALKNNEKIVVSGDNDADGVTSTAIAVRYLNEKFGDKVVDYIYAERNWGHGIAEQIKMPDEPNVNDGEKVEDWNKRCDNANKNKQSIYESDLLIIVDSSSNDVEACELILENTDCDIIILDHHEINDGNQKLMKEAGVILVNPQQDGCNYPNKHLSGAGVVYKVMQLTESILNLSEDEELYPYKNSYFDVEQFMDLVAVGISADMMDVSVPENRYFIINGLLNINNMGIERILKSAKGTDINRLDSDSIGFTIGPLINGTARLGNIQDAFELLLSDEDKEVKRIRLRMHKANEARKNMQKEIGEKLSQNIDDSEKVILVITEESSSGFNGLIAQELAQKYKRPVFVGKQANGMIQGSVRSYGGYQMRTFLDESGLVEYASGHEGALGVGFKEEKLQDLYAYIEDNAKIISADDMSVKYDIHLSMDELEDSIDIIQSFNHITGTNCGKIIVRVDGIMVDERAVIGSNNNTVKITTEDELVLIKFRVDEFYADELGPMDIVSAVGQLKWNIFYNFGLRQEIKTMQIMIDDYRLEE